MKFAINEARVKLTHLFPDDYRRFYLEEKGDKVGSLENAKARSRAITRLANLHPNVFRVLYNRAIYEGATRSYPSSNK